MELTYGNLLRSVTEEYLENLDITNPPTPAAVEEDILDLCNQAIFEFNAGPEDPPGSHEFPFPRKGDDRYTKLKKLEPVQLANILIVLHHACVVCIGDGVDRSYCPVAVYVDKGEDEGIYSISEDYIASVIREYSYTVTQRDIAEVISILRNDAPVRERCTDVDLVAVNNGLYDYSQKMLMLFDPELVFLSKSNVNFVDNAPNPVITMPDNVPWDVESWMKSLSDDPEIVNLLWEILGAIIRPSVPWHKSPWFYSELGNNGKGTLCALMRNLCGAKACASLSLDAFNERFGLDSLAHVSAIINDENNVDAFLDQAASMKAIITQDPIKVDRKFKDSLMVTFYGVMVQCINALPRLKDKSDSIYRRLLIIPFEKRFEGVERKYIKDDYLKRKDVLEYVLYKILATTDYYELSQPQACLDLLGEYKQTNDPVRDFMDDILDRCAWDTLPWQFIYDLYVGWMKRNNGAGKPVSRLKFTKEVRRLIAEYPTWSDNNGRTIRRSASMDKPEYLIAEYDLRSWMNSHYMGNNKEKICVPDDTSCPDTFKGLMRV